MTDNLENEEQASERRVSDWGEKLRFDRSFYAKLMLSDRQVKEYYAEIATELLSYEKVRASMSWAGVGFTAGRSRIAYIAFRGKTLCLYLALDPDTLTEGRYKAQNVAEVKSRAKTPAMFRIRSDGAKRNALARIAETAERAGLLPRPDGGTPVSAKDFPADTFGNLITRGLIRVLRRDSNPYLKRRTPSAKSPSGHTKTPSRRRKNFSPATRSTATFRSLFRRGKEGSNVPKNICSAPSTRSGCAR